MRNKLNLKRILLIVLTVFGVMQAACLFLLAEFMRENNRSCNPDPSKFDTFCGVTPTWLLATHFLAALIFLLLVILSCWHGLHRLSRAPKSINLGLWVAIVLQVLFVLGFTFWSNITSLESTLIQ